MNINTEYLKNYNFKNAVEDEDEDEDQFSKSNKKPANSNSKTPILDSFSRDLTKMAVDGKLDIIVGRNKEIERVSQILSRRKKNNPILIGEPGVGKSAIAEGLAIKIVQRKCSRILFNKRIVILDLASMVAGTKYRGQFEERIKALMGELEKNPDVILFIDEIHTMIGAGGASGSLDASNMFKPALARGEIQIIGATTIDEYRKHIEKDGALERRFQKVMVEPATAEESLQILMNIKDKYENHHHVKYTDEAIRACVDLTNRYMTDRFLPDKAIDALDEAGARVHISNIVVPKDITNIEKKISEIKDKKSEVVRSQRYEEAAKLRDVEKQLQTELESARKKWEEDSKDNRQTVTEENVAEVVSMITGVPLTKVSQNENSKLSKMYESMSGKVIGQEEAIQKVTKAIQRGRVGLKDPNRPIGSFIFLGPTGVGKCHGKGTKILMYDGSIKNVEDVKSGDLLMGDDSKPRRVLSLARGKDKMYKINPIKGDSFICNAPHILSLKNTTTKNLVNIPLNEYLSKSNTFKHTHKLWRTKVEFPSREVKIDPYLIGLWLGDGTTKELAVTTADAEIANYLSDVCKQYSLILKKDDQIGNLSSIYYLNSGIRGGTNTDKMDRNPLLNQFREYGLLIRGSYNKFIPDDYLYNNTEIRKKLLAGLIDSDGYMFHKSYLISTKLEHLSNQIQYLCRSLGYNASITPKIVNGSTYYSINISGDLSDIPVLLNRKKSEIRMQKKDVLVTGFDVEYLGIDDYYGFELDGNHLYLLGDFTVTHNTELAKQLAKYLFDSEDSLIRIDMSEFMEKFSISRLIGAPPGYIGHDEGGQLTEKVRRKPYSVILLDEIEKAHPEVFNLLLQVLDDGQLTDSLGRKVSFKNSIIIMTSNTGSRRLKDFGTGVGFNTKNRENLKSSIEKDIVEKELKKSFAPEFLNRIDDVITFNSLEKEDIEKIVLIEINKLKSRVTDLEFDLDITQSAIDNIVKNGFDPQYGARPLKRAIQKYVEDVVTEEIIASNPSKGSKITLDYNSEEDKMIVKVSKKKRKKDEEESGEN